MIKQTYPSIVNKNQQKNSIPAQALSMRFRQAISDSKDQSESKLETGPN